MQDVNRYIDANFDRFVDELVPLCRIASVSSANTGLDECVPTNLDKCPAK